MPNIPLKYLKKKKLLLWIASRLETLMDLTQEEKDALDANTSGLAKLGDDITRFAGDVLKTNTAQGNIITTLQTQLKDAQTQAGMSATQITEQNATIEQMKSAANSSSAAVVSGLTMLGTTISSVDDVVNAADKAANNAANPPQAPPIDTPPVVVDPPVVNPPVVNTPPVVVDHPVVDVPIATPIVDPGTGDNPPA